MGNVFTTLMRRYIYSNFYKAPEEHRRIRQARIQAHDNAGNTYKKDDGEQSVSINLPKIDENESVARNNPGLNLGTVISGMENKMTVMESKIATLNTMYDDVESKVINMRKIHMEMEIKINQIQAMYDNMENYMIASSNTMYEEMNEIKNSIAKTDKDYILV